MKKRQRNRNLTFCNNGLEYDGGNRIDSGRE